MDSLLPQFVSHPSSLLLLVETACIGHHGMCLHHPSLFHSCPHQERFQPPFETGGTRERVEEPHRRVRISIDVETKHASMRASGCVRRTFRVQATSSTPPKGPSKQLPYTSHRWTWKGHDIRYASAGCGPPVLLVHGFGANVEHFRKNIPVLAQKHKVYAVDLLGFGQSAKPADFQHRMEEWRDLLVEFVNEFIDEPVVLVGNSIGSLACVMATAELGDQVKALALLNCSGGMNNKAVADDWRLKVIYPALKFVDYLLSIKWLAQRIFNAFRSRENIKSVLSSVYIDKQSVDDELVDLIYNPSCDEGALETFVSIITGPPGPSPKALIPSIHCPILLMWGSRDTLTPLNGPLGKYFQELPNHRADTEFILLDSVGHCPHDEAPALVHSHLLPWLEKQNNRTELRSV